MRGIRSWLALTALGAALAACGGTSTASSGGSTKAGGGQPVTADETDFKP